MTITTEITNSDSTTNANILKTQNDVLNARDVANYLRVGYTKALSLMKRDMPSVKFGNTYRITRYSLEDWLKKKEANKPTVIN